jgi:hypothetical protein
MSIKLSEEDLSDLQEILPVKLNHAFGKLPSFSLPSSLSHSIEVRESKLESLADAVMDLVNNYTPQRFLKTVNALMQLGLKDGGGLMKGGAQGGFIVKDREKIKSALISSLRKQQFIEEQMPFLVGIAKNVQKSLLQKNFEHVEVVSQDSDKETLNILRPRRHEVGIIVYKIRK